MIFGVDHLALSFHGLEASLDEIKKIGYDVKFVHENLPNSEMKKSFLSSYDPIHAVAYCQSKNSVALELTDHRTPLRAEISHYQVLMNRRPEKVSTVTQSLPYAANLWKKILGCDVESLMWEPFHTQLWSVSEKNAVNGSAIRAVLLPVADLERSRVFWTEGLGCKVFKEGKEEGRSWIHMAWRSMLPAWSLEIILLETKEKLPKPYLDQAGFPCIAFLSNDLVRDRQRLMQSGGKEASEPSAHVINGKPLTITMLRGPSDEIVELIEMERKSPVKSPASAK